MVLLCVVHVVQSRPNVTIQRSLSSPRATVASGDERTRGRSLVYRTASMRESSSQSDRCRPSWVTSSRQSSSASSSPSSTRRSDPVTAAAGQVPGPDRRAATGAGGAGGRAAAAVSMLPTATHGRRAAVHRRSSTPSPSSTDNSLSPSRTNVQQRLKVNNTSHFSHDRRPIHWSVDFMCVCVSALRKENGLSYQHQTWYRSSPWQPAAGLRP